MINYQKLEVMKKQIKLMAIGLGVIFTINACQTPEERAKEMNNKEANTSESETADNNTSMNNDSTYQYNENNATAEQTSPKDSAVVTEKKPARGKASVDMSTTSASSNKNVSAQVMPSYPGGEQSLEKFVEDNLQYPQEALDNGIEGRVLVTFDVDENGKIFRPSIASEKIGYGLEEEALRVIKSMPQWNPGKLKGKNVKTKFTLPIIYQII